LDGVYAIPSESGIKYNVRAIDGRANKAIPN
jgi:hypothetical protein